MTLAAAVLAFRDLTRAFLHRPNGLSRNVKIALWIFAGWAIVAIASLVDLQIGDRLYLPAEAFDQNLRAALAAAAVRTGVPPANPFFYPGHAVALRYYYYWNVVCALPAKLFGLNPRLMALSGVVWSGFALASLIPLYLKHFCEETVELGRKSLIGIALLLVTGLDLIPTVMIFFSQHTIFGDMEWWDGAQVTSWIDSLLWVPHHVAGMVACLIGFLVLWTVPRNAPAGQRLKVALVAALAFACAAGLSAYVTFTFAIFLVIWTLVLLRSKLTAEAMMFIVAGIITVVLSLPYLHDLRQPGETGSFATFYVRSLESVEDWAEQTIPWNWVHSIFLVLLLPLYYTIEFGFFALIGFVQTIDFFRRSTPLVKWEWAAVSICGVSLLVGSFLMSTTGNNDLGYRSVLFSQFILLLWAVPYVYRWRSGAGNPFGNLRLLFLTFFWIGVLGTVYQLAELRVFAMIAEDGKYVDEVTWLPRSDNLGEDLFLTRSSFETLNKNLPGDAILQYNPTNPAYVPNNYYLRRQTVDGLPSCGTAFGGDPFLCLGYQNQILTAFNGKSALNMQDANRLCDDLGIDVLIAERSDRTWALRQSWVWTPQPLIANDYLRAVACGRRRGELEARFKEKP